jgi:putative redox protein
VALHHERIPPTEGEAMGGRSDRISIALTLDGPLSEQQRERLRVIAGRCPVHRLLAPVVEFHETLEPPAR